HFYQLDKTASRTADNDRGNLVLRYQGVQPFADTLLNLTPRKPRVGILVVHEALTTEGSEEVFALAGLRQTLTTNGFEIRDVVLRQGGRRGRESAAADTFEETKYERLLEERDGIEQGIKALQARVRSIGEMKSDFQKMTLDELSRKYARQLGGRKLTADRQRQNLAEQLADELDLQEKALREAELQLQETKAELGKIDVDRATEQRRMTDIRAKLDRILSECDLLLIPRLTRRPNGQMLSNEVHKLDKVHLDALKNYLKRGKP